MSQIDFASIRSRLAGAQGRLYWRSLGQLADTPEFREYLHREFPEQASQWNDPKGRRDFLKLMSASLALAGISACTKQPPEKIIPYVRQPEQMVPGRPLFYATAIPFGGIAAPVLVESHEGHPTKVEGNPQHPDSLGATDIFAQAAILGLYDPDRAQTVAYRGAGSSWDNFVAAIRGVAAVQKQKQGAGIHFLTETMTSPSVAEQVTLIRQAYPQAKWHQWDAVARGTRAASTTTDAFYHFDKADIVVTLEADFLGCGQTAVRYTRDFARRRRVFDGLDDTGKATTKGEMNRLYAIESTPTLTGAKADHRLILAAAEIETAGRMLGSGIGAGGNGGGGTLSNPAAAKFIAAVAKDLQAHRGKSVVVPGEYQPAAVHALARAMNEALGNVGTTVNYLPVPEFNAGDPVASLKDLTNAIDAGQVELLVILGGNPVFTAPADLNFQARLQKVPLAVHHALYVDETSGFCHWFVPEAHALESWGDARAVDGTVTIMQPLIAPLYDGRTVQEVLSCFIDDQNGKSSHDLVKDFWLRAQAGKAGTWKITDPTGQPFKSPDSFWKHVLNDGFITGTAFPEGGGAAPPAGAAPAASAQAPTPSGGSGLEIIFRPDPTIWDGRFANVGWLQELPKPLTKLTWDPAAWVSPKLAEQYKLSDGDVIELRFRGTTVKLPVLIVFGQPERSVTAHFGYGRWRTGRVGTPADDLAKEFNVYRLRPSDALWFSGGLEIAKTGERYLLARTQTQQTMEDRAPVRVAGITEYQQDPQIIDRQGDETPPRSFSLIPAWEYNSYQWAMAIDLTSCIGCSSCEIACVAENNIAVVGKEQVNAGRYMHWIRVDHYYSGNDFDNPEMYHQPIPCQQCENAPCELVCPVGATTHSSEGLNDMVYNRCVGTRYCSNNCPYKVRRFNFLLYSDWYTPSLEPMRNPDVTVRSRGVMEKCTYCVQRINAAKIDSERENRRVRDGEIVTACQGACPADAIVFGDISDPNSRVSKLKALNRNYGILEGLNTRPRTTYLAAIRNPNPELA